MNGLSEEDTFWFLSITIEQLLPSDYYKDLGTISITSMVLNDLVREYFPDFVKEMEEIGMDISMFLVSWFVCLFSKGFINSVSFYLISFLIMHVRHYDLGYLLVYLGLGIVSTVLSQESPFSFETKNFSKEFNNSRNF